MHPLQLHFLKFFSPRRYIPSRPVPLSPSVKSLCLLWGSQEFLLQGKSFSPPPPCLLISSDASNLGWGAFLDPYHVSGIWSPQESHLHIYSLELLAVYLALQSFEDLFFGLLILIRSDNSTVVSYINHQGGTRPPFAISRWFCGIGVGREVFTSQPPMSPGRTTCWGTSSLGRSSCLQSDSESLGFSEDSSFLPSSGDTCSLRRLPSSFSSFARGFRTPKLRL